MSSKKVVCVGEILWDALPEGLFLGGAPFNVACHLHHLGVEAAMVSSLGKDVPGAQAYLRAGRQGMATRWLQSEHRHPTGLVNISLNDSGDASYEIVEPAAWDFIEVNPALIELVQQADALIFGSLAQRNPVSRKTIVTLRRKSKYSVFDVNLRPPFDNRVIVEASLHDAQIVKLNDQEMRQLSRWFSWPGKLEDAARNLISEFTCETVCITLAEKGAALLHNGVWTTHPGYRVRVEDTVGAGDAFLAALLHGILSKNNTSEILAKANAVGAYVATQRGATPPLNFDWIDRLTNPQK